jgi:hypothetical protein
MTPGNQASAGLSSTIGYRRLLHETNLRSETQDAIRRITGKAGLYSTLAFSRRNLEFVSWVDLLRNSPTLDEGFLVFGLPDSLDLFGICLGETQCTASLRLLASRRFIAWPRTAW